MSDCPFCNYEGPSPILAAYPEHGCFVIEPLEPVTEGHVLVIPYEHVENIAKSERTASDVGASVAIWIAESGDPPNNVIISMGAEATQSVNHLHAHVVPRREDDGLMLPWSRRSDEYVSQIRRTQKKLEERDGE